MDGLRPGLASSARARARSARDVRRVERQEEPQRRAPRRSRDLASMPRRAVPSELVARASTRLLCSRPRAHPRRALRGLDDARTGSASCGFGSRAPRPTASRPGRAAASSSCTRTGEVLKLAAHAARAASTLRRPRRRRAGRRRARSRCGTGQPAGARRSSPKAHHASWALGMRLGALDEVMERFGARARRGDDLTAQALLLVDHRARDDRRGGDRVVAAAPARLPGADAARRASHARRPLPRRPRHRPRALRRRGAVDVLRRAPPRARRSTSSRGPTSSAPRWGCSPATGAATTGTSRARSRIGTRRSARLLRRGHDASAPCRPTGARAPGAARSPCATWCIAPMPVGRRASASASTGRATRCRGCACSPSASRRSRPSARCWTRPARASRR